MRHRGDETGTGWATRRRNLWSRRPASARSGASPRAVRHHADLFESGKIETLEPRTLLSSVIEQDNTLVRLETNQGDIVLELLEDEAPQTVTAFLGYINDGSYDGSVFHRSADYQDGSNFVLQGGGFEFNEQSGFFDDIPDSGTIQNEPGVSNLERTVAMAKLGGDPDSATREFFFNLSDRNATDESGARLDFQNEGFTVFARVVDGWDVVLAISDLPKFDGGGAFTDLPVTAQFDPNNPNANADGFVTIESTEVLYTGGGRSVTPQGEVIGSADPTGRPTLVTTVDGGSEDDRIEYFRFDSESGRWTQRDVLAASGRSSFEGAVETFADALTQRTSVVAADTTGVLILSTLDDETWISANLTTSIAGAEPIVSDVTVFESQEGWVYVSGLTESGDLVVYQRVDSTWGYQNLTRTDFAAINQSLPELEGEIVSYVTSWNGLNIAGLDSEGRIWAAWTAPGLDGWRVSNLSARTGAPAYEGTLTGFLTTWGAINLAGTTSTGSVVTTWWLPSFGADWRQSDLTAAFGGPALSGDSISSYVTPWGGLNVAGLDGDGNVVAYWWAPGLTDWRIADLSALVTDVDRPGGAIRGFTSGGGVINLVGADNDGDVIRYAFDPATLQWTGTDVSTTTLLTIET